MHGTLTRDCDLIAAPWIETAASPEQLADALRDMLGGWFSATIDGMTMLASPHGRVGWCINVAPWGLRRETVYFDLSVMPRSPPG